MAGAGHAWLLPLGAISPPCKFGQDRNGSRHPIASRCGNRRSTLMNRSTAGAVVLAALSLGMASAHAGPCTAAITQFEQAVRASAGNPSAGPLAPQSVGAQTDREPTAASVARAKKRARAAFERQLAH